jgi:hypothetical protein
MFSKTFRKTRGVILLVSLLFRGLQREQRAVEVTEGCRGDRGHRGEKSCRRRQGAVERIEG